MKHGKREADYLEEMLYQEAKNKRNERHYYRNLILRCVATFGIGTIFAAFLKAFGLGGFLIALALCLFSTMFALTL